MALILLFLRIIFYYVHINIIYYFYNPSLNTIILNKNGAYFEPVVFVINNENKLFVEKEFNSQLPQIDNLFNILKEGCKERYTINWNEYLLSKNKNAFVSDKRFILKSTHRFRSI